MGSKHNRFLTLKILINLRKLEKKEYIFQKKNKIKIKSALIFKIQSLNHSTKLQVILMDESKPNWGGLKPAKLTG